MVNPTQYLNAVEYANYSGEGENHMAIMTRYSESIKLIDELGASDFWTSVKQLHVPLKHEIHSNKALWILRRKFMEEAFQIVKPDELIVGNVGDSSMYPFTVRQKNKVEKVTYLDDGTPSFYVSEQRFHGGFLSEWHMRSSSYQVKNLLYNKVLLPLSYPPESMRFFSIYKLNTLTKDVFIENQYTWVKSKILNKEIEKGAAYFIGSHIVDRQLISRKEYLSSLTAIQNTLREEGLKFFYVHHRGESEGIRNELRSKFDCLEFKLPLELVFLNQTKPEVFAGQFSSALFNLSRIYSDQQTRAFLFKDGILRGTANESLDYLVSTQKAIFNDDRIDSAYIEV